MNRRTDLAQEAHELWRDSAGKTTELRGVLAREHREDGIEWTEVEILDDQGAQTLGKPIGRYLTIDLTPVRKHRQGAFEHAAERLSKELTDLLNIKESATVLVVGLGNPAVTADAIGPKTLEHLLITRHLVEQLPHFAGFRPVCALAPGVLGTTGLESAEIVRGVIAHAAPACVMTIDALAACDPKRLCSTVQLSNAGVVPGSGIGNRRAAFTEEELGVPVISIGVPTVVRAGTLAAQFGQPDEIPQTLKELIVTPSDMDASLRDLSRLLGYGINLALHKYLTAEEISYYVG
jgi:spore protease